MTSFQVKERAGHLRKFPNDDGSIADLDIYLAYTISKADIDDSRPFFETKWWDYRFVHPGHCLFKWHYDYSRAVKRWRSKFGVHPLAQIRLTEHPIWRFERKRQDGIVITTKERHLQPTGFTTSVWRTMCAADAYGIRYDRWIDWAMQHAFDHQWKRMPLPGQMSTNDMTAHIVERWAAEQAEFRFTPRDPMFLAENYQGHPYQNAFQDWLLGAIAKRPRPEIALAHYLAEEPLVVLDRARETLGAEVVAGALRRISRPHANNV